VNELRPAVEFGTENTEAGWGAGERFYSRPHPCTAHDEGGGAEIWHEEWWWWVVRHFVVVVVSEVVGWVIVVVGGSIRCHLVIVIQLLFVFWVLPEEAGKETRLDQY
jgi:hypothetical protein